MIPGVNKVFEETSPRVFCSLPCGRRKISGEGEEPEDKKFPLLFFLFPHLLQRDVSWLTMTLFNTAEGLFEALLKTIYIPFRYLTSGELWSSPVFQESFHLAIIRRNFELQEQLAESFIGKIEGKYCPYAKIVRRDYL